MIRNLLDILNVAALVLGASVVLYKYAPVDENVKEIAGILAKPTIEVLAKGVQL